MVPHLVPTGEAVRYGWDKVTERLGFWIVLILIVGVLSYVPQAIGQQFGQSAPLLAALINIVGSVISILVSIGTIAISLKVYDGQAVTYGDLFSRRDLFWRYVGVTIVYTVIVMIGFVLLIVPGVIFLVKYQFALYAVVDRGAGVTDAFTASGRLTNGVKWKVFLFDIVLFAVLLVGVAALGIGLLVAWPVVLMAAAYMYRHRAAATGGAPAEPQPAPITP